MDRVGHLYLKWALTIIPSKLVLTRKWYSFSFTYKCDILQTRCTHLHLEGRSSCVCDLSWTSGWTLLRVYTSQRWHLSSTSAPTNCNSKHVYFIFEICFRQQHTYCDSAIMACLSNIKSLQTTEVDPEYNNFVFTLHFDHTTYLLWLCNHGTWLAWGTWKVIK